MTFRLRATLAARFAALGLRPGLGGHVSLDGDHRNEPLVFHVGRRDEGLA